MAICKRCKATNLQWQRTPAGWRLFSNGNLHTCVNPKIEKGKPVNPDETRWDLKELELKPDSLAPDAIPDDLSKLSRTELQQLCNKHELNKLGKPSKGAGFWRAQARRHELENALAIFQGKTPSPDSGPQPDEKHAKMMDAPPPPDDPLAKQMAEKISPYLKLGTDEDAVAKIAQREAAILDKPLATRLTEISAELAELKSAKPTTYTIELKREDKPLEIIEGQHHAFPTFLDLLRLRVNVMAVGPAGSGKTSAAAKAAELLSLPFYSASMSAQTPESRLMGYFDAQGRYVRTLLREAFEHGGIFNVDEIDNSNPNVLAALNNIAENKIAAFPDGMIVRHPDFVVTATANTYGMGANRQYVGRQQLDAASLDRFTILDWPYDEVMELSLAKAHGGDNDTTTKWVANVQKWRHTVDKLGIRHIISPRASMRGAKLLSNSSLSLAQVADLCVWKGLDKETVRKVMA